SAPPCFNDHLEFFASNAGVAVAPAEGATDGTSVTPSTGDAVLGTSAAPAVIDRKGNRNVIDGAKGDTAFLTNLAAAATGNNTSVEALQRIYQIQSFTSKDFTNVQQNSVFQTVALTQTL